VKKNKFINSLSAPEKEAYSKMLPVSRPKIREYKVESFLNSGEGSPDTNKFPTMFDTQAMDATFL